MIAWGPGPLGRRGVQSACNWSRGTRHGQPGTRRGGEARGRGHRQMVDGPGVAPTEAASGGPRTKCANEKQSAHPDKKGSPVPPEGPQRKYLSAGRVESVAV